MNRLHTGGTRTPAFRRLLPALVVLYSLLASSSSATAVATQPSSGVDTTGPVSVNLHDVSETTNQGLSGAAPWLFPGGASALAEQKSLAGASAASPHVQSPEASIATPPALSSPVVGVPAIDSRHSKCLGCYPPDGALAAGASYVVGAVNTALAVWDKSGNLVFGPVSMPAMLSDSSRNPYCPNDGLHFFADPFVEYDGTHAQFIVGMLNYDLRFNTRVCLAATSTGDPTGNWYLYDIPVNLNRTLFDYPQAAVGPNALYVSGNVFMYGLKFTGARVYAVDTAPMYAGTAPENLNLAFHDIALTNDGGDPVDTLMPAKGVTTPDVMYLTSSDNCAGCDQVRLWKWSSPFDADSFTYQGSVTVQSFDQPPAATQPRGNAIETNDAREMASYLRNGTLYAVHIIGCNPGAGEVACVQWYQINNLDSSPSLALQGIVGSNGEFRFFPTMTVDISGNMALGYAYSSATSYAGIRYTGLVHGNSLLEPEQTMVEGEKAVYPTGRLGRYGDYGTEDVDPADGCTIWHLEEYAQSGRLWGTWLGAYRFNLCT